MKKLFGLIGFPLGHSFSSRYFKEKFLCENITDTDYLNFPIENIEDLGRIIESTPNLRGLNVTIPYKQTVMHLLSTISNDAKEIGAVNTIRIERYGKSIITHGYNTDVWGFEQTLKRTGIQLPVNSLIIGTGGSSRAVAWVLQKLNCTITFVSRDPQKVNQTDYTSLKKRGLDQYKLIINTTPLGMYPNIDEFPDIPYSTLTKDHTCIDLIYNPEETLFLKNAKEQGAKAQNGLYMLEQQAEKSWEIWNSTQ